MQNNTVADHYDQGDLVDRIESGFAAVGKTTAELTIDDLAAVDEFHTGGRQATEIIMADLAPAAGSRVLDVGSGLGGAARYCATAFGCNVLGIDLTPPFVEAARALTDWVGLGDSVGFQCTTVQDLPATDERFDAAYMLHVGMNVADKADLFAAVKARLRPGGRLAVYDLMLVGDGAFSYPLPWSSTAETNFIATQAVYEAALADAGFEVRTATDHHELATAFLEAFQQSMAGEGGPPPVGLHLVMGATTPQKAAGVTAALGQRLISPVELIATT